MMQNPEFPGAWKIQRLVAAFKLEHKQRFSRRMYKYGERGRSRELMSTMGNASKSVEALIPADHRKYKQGTMKNHLKDFTFKPDVNEVSKNLNKYRMKQRYLNPR